MAQYKVLNKFRNKETGEIYAAGQEVELTVKRAKEIQVNLESYDVDFLERVDNKDESDDKKNED